MFVIFTLKTVADIRFVKIEKSQENIFCFYILQGDFWYKPYVIIVIGGYGDEDKKTTYTVDIKRAQQ